MRIFKSNRLWSRSAIQCRIRNLWHKLRGLNGTPHSIALGAATGVFIAFSPLIGFHTLLAALACWLFRANLVAAIVGTLLCNPLTFAVFLLADYHAGLLLAGEPLRDDLVLGETQLTFYYVLTNPVDAATDLWGFLSPIFKPMMLGSMILGSLSALVTYYSIRSAVITYQRQPRGTPPP